MKRNYLLLFAALLFLFLFIACREDRQLTIKDLDETMIDLRVYQENLGDELKAGRLKDAVWLLEGMDSVLKEVSRKFNVHRKLTESFSYYYRKEMKQPIHIIRSGIKDDDTSKAMRGYRLLIKNCNGCHSDHDIEKSVNF